MSSSTMIRFPKCGEYTFLIGVMFVSGIKKEECSGQCNCDMCGCRIAYDISITSSIREAIK